MLPGGDDEGDDGCLHDDGEDDEDWVREVLDGHQNNQHCENCVGGEHQVPTPVHSIHPKEDLEGTIRRVPSVGV